jgi:hypothetical protein
LPGKELLQIRLSADRPPSQKKNRSLQDTYGCQYFGKPCDLPLYGKILTFVLALYVTSFGGWLAGGPKRILGATLGVIGIGVLVSSLTMIGFCDSLFWRAEWRSLTG